MPFFSVTNYDIIKMITGDKQQWKDILFNSSLRDHVCKLYGDDAFRSLDSTYITPEHFNHSYSGSTGNIERSVFHVNIQSLNAKHVCQFIETLCVEFDVIVLTEIWSCNIDFYRNILPDYNFYYELPQSGRVGGVGMYVKSSLGQNNTT